MRIRKQFGCAVLAAAMCFCSLQLPAEADSLSPGEWFVCEEFEINCDGVMGYSGNYIYGNSEQEIEYQFQKGDIVYARTAYHSMGIDWVTCYNIEPHEEGAVFYGWVDMAYLSPVGSVVDDPEPEPEPEPEPVVETEPPTDPPTEAPTTIEVTTIATTTVTTILTTLATTEAETTMLTTTTTTQQTEEDLSIVNDQNNDHKNNFFSDNFTLLLIGGIVILLAGSGALAIGLMQHNKKKQMFLPNSPNEQGFVGVRFCSHCGMRNLKTAAFCKKCGKPMK